MPLKLNKNKGNKSVSDWIEKEKKLNFDRTLLDPMAEIVTVAQKNKIIIYIFLKSAISGLLIF